MVFLFDIKSFNRFAVLNKSRKHLKIVRDQYRVHVEMNPRYECPSMIRSTEWKSLVEYRKERALRKQVKLPPGIGRYAMLSKL